MKRLKFAEKLVPLILLGAKTSTWRLFDDKDLSVDDEVEFINSKTGDKFADVKIISVNEKTFADITEDDFETHETYSSKDEMLKTYRGYYGEKVNYDTKVKIIKFELL